MSRPDQPQSSASQPAGASADLIAALSGLDANRNRALTNRTRRAVHDAATDMREGRHISRRSSAIAMLILAGFLMLLSPAIWSSIDDAFGGGTLLDLPGIVAALAFTLFAAVAAVLFLIGGQGRRDFR
jgi:hypothetical protein